MSELAKQTVNPLEQMRVGTVRQHRPTLTKRWSKHRMANRANIDIETLRQLLTYDPETGSLAWRERPLGMFRDLRRQRIWNARYAGTPALACNVGGYCKGNIFDKSFKAHRVAWALHFGRWPEGDIDQINGDGSDNRISNLRVVDHQTNMRNVKLRSGSVSGVPGVSWFARKQKWQVRIGTTHIGYFETLSAATDARHQAERRLGFHPNHGRSR